MDARSRMPGNLSDAEQDRRLRIGVVAFGAALALAVALLKMGAVPAVRLVLFVPFFVGTAGVTMGLFRTCSLLAARGLRDRGSGPEKITSRRERALVRQLALRVLVIAGAAATLATGLFMALP